MFTFFTENLEKGERFQIAAWTMRRKPWCDYILFSTNLFSFIFLEM